MYHIVLCEDNTHFIEYLEGIILRAGVTATQVQFYEFSSGESFVDYLKHANCRCDLLILDMQLPGMDGDEVAECFRERFPSTILVFCSGTMRPTDRSFKAMAYRYLYKEYTEEKMLEEMQEIIQRMITHKAEPTVMVHNYFKHICLHLDEILYIQLAKRGSKVTLCPNVRMKDISGDLLAVEKLDELYDMLKDFGFAYAHNSYIVNLKYVKKIQKNQLVFFKWPDEETERIMNISRARLQELREAFARELGNKYQR